MGDISLNLNPQVPALPRFEDKTKIDVRYMVIAPYVSIHIYYDSKAGEVVYDVEEPIISDGEKANLKKIEQAMREVVDVNMAGNENGTEGLLDYIDKTARLIISELGLVVEEDAYKKMFYYLYRNFIGLNEIEAMMQDYFIEDIECNGAGEPMYIVHRVFRNIKTNVRFDDMDKLSSFVEKLAQKTGRYISYANPILDGSLPDGSRVNATYTQDITSKGPTFTIRKFTKTPWTPIQLLGFHTMSPEMLAYFWILLQYQSNMMIVGGTASGKTTLLNALAFFIPQENRVVSIEDSVTGDSRIVIKQGESVRNILIKEYVDDKIDAEVMTLDRDGLVVFCKPSAQIKHVVNKDVYEIRTSSGRTVKVTEDHSLFSLVDSGLVDVKPKDLVEGKSFVAVPRSYPSFGREVRKINLMENLKVFEDDFLVGEPLAKFFEKFKRKDLDVAKECYRWWKCNNLIKIRDFVKFDFKFSEEELGELKIKSKNTGSVPVLFDVTKNFLEFCGLWLGDGSYDNYNGNCVIISNRDEECREVFEGMRDYLGSGSSLMSDGGVSMRLHNKIFYKFMKYFMKFDGYSSTKKIPDFIFGLSDSQVRDFIRGYYSADGGMKKFEVSCASQSYEMLEDFQTLFLKFGVLSRIVDFARKDKCMCLNISGVDNIDKFKEIGFLQKRKNDLLYVSRKSATHDNSDIIPLSVSRVERLNEVCDVNLQHGYTSGRFNIGRKYMQKIAPIGCEFNDLSHNDILWDRVRSIKKLPKEEREVFDLSMPGFEKFIVNNIFVHNTRELNLPRENWLPSVVRGGISGAGIGEVDMFSLLRSSFRQNPDYVIVGEVRGKEASVLFQGMASGHASISTMHGDSVDSIIRRLETPPISLSPMLVNGLDVMGIMTHAIVNGQETRRLREIVEVVKVEPDGTALTNTPFSWSPADDKFYFKKDSKIFDKISAKMGIPREELNKEFAIRTKLIYALFQHKVLGYEEVQRVVNDYAKDPQGILKKYGVV